jgi:hypothetical protein
LGYERIAGDDGAPEQRFGHVTGAFQLLIFAAGSELWTDYRMQLELPRHQVHAHRDGAFIDILLSDIAHGVWRYRRTPPAVLRSFQGMLGVQHERGESRAV